MALEVGAHGVLVSRELRESTTDQAVEAKKRAAARTPRGLRRQADAADQVLEARVGIVHRLKSSI
jgi:tellurite resistance protein